MSEGIAFMLELVQLIKLSPKCLTIFEQFRKNLSFSADGHYEYAAKGRGLLSRIESFDTFNLQL